jgi:predicted DNA-binding protein
MESLLAALDRLTLHKHAALEPDMPELHPQFLTDTDGKPRSVLLPIEEYAALLDRLEDLEDLEDAREVLARVDRGEEETIPWEAVQAEHGL